MGRITTRTLWTREKDAQLQKLLDQGLNSTQIAGLMGFNTRSAILGRISRLGLQLKASRQRTWTPEMDAQLAQLAAQGLTAYEIGEQMGKDREAIKSRVKHLRNSVRLGAANQYGHMTMSRRKTVAPLKRKVTTEERAEIKAKLREIDAPVVMLEDLERKQCRYPVTDTVPFGFCMKPQERGVYCLDHYKLTHQHVAAE